MRPPAACISSRGPLRRLYSSGRTVKENDILFVRQQGDKHPRWHLTPPLRPDTRVKLSYGVAMYGRDFIGKQLLDAVHDEKGRKVVLHAPSIGSYIINSARFATPIYPHDATTIVSLLDLHPSRPGEEEEDGGGGDGVTRPPLEIFEAGTGMGSLTLHLARALHAANPAVSPTLRKALCEAPYQREAIGLDLEPDMRAQYDAYRASRRAVLHTLDRNPKHTRAAHKLVRNYRRALYFPTVDFHVGAITTYIEDRLAANDGQPVFSHAILDLPSAHDNAESVIRALQPNGLLILFKPSISQLADFQAWALATHQPLHMEKVLELPTTTTPDGARDTVGGREWDLKMVTPRGADAESKPVQVMRPKVGDRVAGGGFVAVLRRWPVQEDGEAPLMEEEMVSEQEDLAEEQDTELEGESEERPERI